MAIAPYGQRLFRPPYGDQTGASSLNALWTGYKVVTWNLVAEDWLDHDADWMANLLLEGIQPGSIILLHDNLYQNGGVRNGKRQQMLKAIEIFLQQVGNRYHFVTVPELLKHGRPQRQNWDKS
jgi:peptidoglycan/xylan/chitin deacetylase (PgdA/CDA1 family)